MRGQHSLQVISILERNVTGKNQAELVSPVDIFRKRPPHTRYWPISVQKAAACQPH